MKRTIRLTESELRGMINEAVKKALNETRNVVKSRSRGLRESTEEEMSWRRLGIDPRIIDALNSAESIQIPNDDGSGETYESDDFGIWMWDGVPQITVSNWSLEGDEAIPYIKKLVDDVKKHGDAKRAWDAFVYEDWFTGGF